MKRLALPIAAAVFLGAATGPVPVYAMPPWDTYDSGQMDSWEEDYDKEENYGKEMEELRVSGEEKESDADMKEFEDKINKAMEEFKRGKN